ncbi:hypothetical protein P3X46_001786 [Hevea brasiliensis]|uniref:DFDF domain-containing protein n=1 Tax=Hevea brasiliensis TaxID=3981 RepID=A0ABQ9NE35_HEVBR|nr:protein EARLY RESPONSIVE TO DEHYDRATION 15 [Hevea brasiliensis]XP_021675307.2 protein EARLY RESPONSIVE TO DEHYDRATION 15 [Hevea brasiliensis]XP_021675312.2 protein EARLY RESPONSIVE TO DEHYDRATION 15 [Hevea brasiliensis]XP_021675321.2 protein EARLY RESPONSIVE TO DEHYDRATION 15 [Hevea brasiliensis]KAJ9190601.1 hypothetical protein P3X46_001786 [Hevea brasiliensis]
MALVAGQRSTLNPNAPLFIPAVYRQVEDFSPEWWELVKTSTWFRDYWLSQHPEGSFDGGVGDDDDDVVDLLPEKLDVDFDEEYANLEAQFEELIVWNEEEKEEQQRPLNGVKMDVKRVLKELSIPKSGKERSVKSPAKLGKYQTKAAHCGSPKSTPRRIHQIQQPR